MDEKIINELKRIARGAVCKDESMREHTTIKIGGPADVWFEPVDVEDLVAVLKFVDENKIHKTIFGNGSNALVTDKGIRGIVISLNKFDNIELIEQLTSEDKKQAVVRVGAGVPLQKLISWSLDNSLSGLENLTGIPGTIGGAVFMNAGTADGSVGDAVQSVSVVNKGKIIELSKDKMEFGYRKTKLPKGGVVVGAVILLSFANKDEIEARINKIRNKRKDTQPLLWPSMGSVFRNPSHGRKAWQLIDECGLRDVRVGGARISNEHANWIINEGAATSKDVEVLIKLIREKVREKSGINLETEIVIIGE